MERLEPRVRGVWFAGTVLTSLLLGGGLLGVHLFVTPIGRWVGPAVGLLLLLVGGAFVLARYRVWRFEIRDDSLYLERGVLTRVRTVVPFVRVQHVDSERGPVERALGLASVVVYTAGSRGADVTIPGLSPERAEDLQERLRRLAIDSEFEDAV